MLTPMFTPTLCAIGSWSEGLDQDDEAYAADVRRDKHGMAHPITPSVEQLRGYASRGTKPGRGTRAADRPQAFSPSREAAMYARLGLATPAHTIRLDP